MVYKKILLFFILTILHADADEVFFRLNKSRECLLVRLQTADTYTARVMYSLHSGKYKGIAQELDNVLLKKVEPSIYKKTTIDPIIEYINQVEEKASKVGETTWLYVKKPEVHYSIDVYYLGNHYVISDKQFIKRVLHTFVYSGREAYTPPKKINNPSPDK